MQPNQQRIFGDYQAAASGQQAGLVAATGGARFASYTEDEKAALPRDAVECNHCVSQLGRTLCSGT